MHGESLLIIFVLLFGCAAFLFGVIYLIGRTIGWLVSGLANLFGFRRDRLPDMAKPVASNEPVCTREGCGRIERRRGARYCGHCGAPLA